MSSGRFIINNTFFHRLVGARGSASSLPPVPNWRQDEQPQDVRTTSKTHGIFLAKNKPPNWGEVYALNSAANEIAQHRMVFFGEIHSRPPIISFQRAVQMAMATDVPDIPSEQGKGTLHVIFEHFSFEMQELLDEFINERLTFDEMVERYEKIGTENHDLEPYRSLLEDAKRLNKDSAATNKHRKVQLHAGFLPRKYAKLLMKEGEEVCFQSAAPWLPPNPQLTGTEQHYNIFESLLTGRSLTFDNGKQPDDRFRSIFQAQLLKDVAMAHKINEVVDKSSQGKDKVLVLVGNGHILGYSGVPERVLERHPELADETCVMVSNHGTELPTKGDEGSLKSSILHHLTNSWGPCNLADYIYVYREQQETSSPTVNDADIKEETKAAYDKVGETAQIQGNTAKAKAIMKAMHYTDEQINIAGDDVYNFQGVGNPHARANIQPGETVLDVGSGLGIDSFIAQAATEHGFVLGIDLSHNEVKHAQLCSRKRKLDRIRFATADMEQIPLPDNSVDVVISNGAFCLAPDKEKAFREVYRVLKPGGRISICTTTTQDESKLEPGVSWPVCMKMFVPKNDIVPICERIGYVDVVVDDSDSSMSMELPIEVLQQENPNSPQRSKVHVGSAEFSHLEDYDMDKLCARVCVVARKPHTN